MADAQTADTFQFELVSPERVLASEQARMVVIPGAAGEFGVLAGHTSLLSSLRPGVVSVTLPSGEVRKIFVAGGFADVTGALCSVLAEEAVNVNDLNRAEIEQQARNLAEDISLAKGDAVKTASLQSQLDVANAKLAALQ